MFTALMVHLCGLGPLLSLVSQVRVFAHTTLCAFKLPATLSLSSAERLVMTLCVKRQVCWRWWQLRNYRKVCLNFQWQEREACSWCCMQVNQRRGILRRGSRRHADISEGLADTCGVPVRGWLYLQKRSRSLREQRTSFCSCEFLKKESCPARVFSSSLSSAKLST